MSLARLKHANQHTDPNLVISLFLCQFFLFFLHYVLFTRWVAVSTKNLRCIFKMPRGYYILLDSFIICWHLQCNAMLYIPKPAWNGVFSRQLNGAMSVFKNSIFSYGFIRFPLLMQIHFDWLLFDDGRWFFFFVRSFVACTLAVAIRIGKMPTHSSAVATDQCAMHFTPSTDFNGIMTNGHIVLVSTSNDQYELHAAQRSKSR